MAARFDLGAFAYAHRGLWSPDGPPENSKAAFAAAAAAGLGVELDVRPAADGVPVVFHDPMLDRMTAQSGLVCDRYYGELVATRLGGSDETIPTLGEVLGGWTTNAPVLVELKIDGATDARVFAKHVAGMLERFSGPAAAMSFDETAVATLPRTIQRGLLITPIAMTDETRFEASLERARDLGVDYVAVWHADAQRVPADLPLAVWTVSTTADLEALGARPTAVIFEHLDPALVRREHPA